MKKKEFHRNPKVGDVIVFYNRNKFDAGLYHNHGVIHDIISSRFFITWFNWNPAVNHPLPYLYRNEFEIISEE